MEDEGAAQMSIYDMFKESVERLSRQRDNVRALPQ